jgi:DNA ligase-1
MFNSFSLKYLCLLTFSFIVAPSLAKETPKIQLATAYTSNSINPIKINEYFISEKLDGIRGYWNGKNLFTRAGNVIYAPTWFTKNWPNTHMDGELWSEPSKFEKISSCVRKKKPIQNIKKSCWKKIRFMIFDLSSHSGTFSQRIEEMKHLTHTVNSAYLLMIKQKKTTSIALLHQQLKNIVKDGGEGLMLHHQDAYYKTGRNSDLMKLKQHDDAEAIVIAYIPGKGKYTNKLGSLKVKMPSGLTFKIGSGFSDAQREKPPAIGSQITYKYIGKTARGVPKFASFLRVREFIPIL